MSGWSPTGQLKVGSPPGTGPPPSVHSPTPPDWDNVDTSSQHCTSGVWEEASPWRKPRKQGTWPESFFSLTHGVRRRPARGCFSQAAVLQPRAPLQLPPARVAAAAWTPGLLPSPLVRKAEARGKLRDGPGRWQARRQALGAGSEPRHAHARRGAAAQRWRVVPAPLPSSLRGRAGTGEPRSPRR